MYVRQWGDFPESIRLFETEVVLPEPPAKKSLLLNYNRPDTHQKWVRPELPGYWSDDYLRRMAVHHTKGGKPDLNWWKTKATPEMIEYAEQEWDKRLNGIWIFIHGKPLWFPGEYYFYLQWYMLDDGYPDFRDRDRRWELMWHHVRNDPNSFGLLYIKHRRDGFSFRGGKALLEHGSRTPNAHNGFQNKVGKDAQAKFTEIVVNPLAKQPAFFRPLRTGTNNPKSGLEFKTPMRRITSSNIAMLTEEDDALDTIIDFRNTVANAYDGQKLHRYMIDEAAKMVEANVMDMWGIVKKALTMRGQQPGKAIIGSTLLEDQELESSLKAVENFQTLWEQSDPSAKLPGGGTVSGLTRYFAPAFDGLQYEQQYFFNEWGESETEKAQDFLQAKRQFLKDRGHMKSLNMEIRQFPFSPEEAFRPSGGASALDHEKIIDCLQFLEANNLHGRPNWTDYVAEGDLLWVNGFGSEVRFVPKKGGDFRINMEIFNHIKQNFVRKENTGKTTLFKPLNRDKLGLGIDPIEYDKDELATGTFSLAACLGVWKYDPKMEMNAPDPTKDPDFGKHWKSYSFILEYMTRPNKSEIFFEDMFKACFFFGCEAAVETNKGRALKQYFQARGGLGFLQDKAKILHRDGSNNNTKGNPATEMMHTVGFDKWRTFVCDHCYPHRIPFPKLLNQLLKFDHTNHTKLDLYCAGEQVLIGVDPYVKPKQTESIKFELPTYKIKGNRSVLR